MKSKHDSEPKVKLEWREMCNSGSINEYDENAKDLKVVVKVWS